MGEGGTVAWAWRFSNATRFLGLGGRGLAWMGWAGWARTRDRFLSIINYIHRTFLLTNIHTYLRIKRLVSWFSYKPSVLYACTYVHTLACVSVSKELVCLLLVYIYITMLDSYLTCTVETARVGFPVGIYSYYLHLHSK